MNPVPPDGFKPLTELVQQKKFFFFNIDELSVHSPDVLAFIMNSVLLIESCI